MTVPFRNPTTTLPASAIEGEIQGSQLAADAIDGKLITGSTIRTAADGKRILLTPEGDIILFSGAASETAPGELVTGITSDGSEMQYGYLVLKPPTHGPHTPPEITLSVGPEGEQYHTLGPLNLMAEAGQGYATVTGILTVTDDVDVFGTLHVGGRRVPVPEEWTTLTAGAWNTTPSLTTYQSLRIGTDGTRAYLDGAASTKTAYSSGGQNAFTIPPELRPLKNHYYAAPRATSGSPPALGCLVQPSGVVVIYTSSAVATSDTYDFTGMSWPLD
ncbi:hypothetical protein [Streptomyces sp. NPDC096105]|uniref:hypothetical protein n=1 Tax=Streptomyces sp. NPDC096105 TaxID=3366074 RepID=UPI0038050ADC